MSEEVDNSETTGELTNASAACGPTPTLVVRRPDEGSRPEIPVMTLRSHSRGGRSSACALEPSRQAGSYTTENLGVQPARPQKFGPEPEIRSSHINYPMETTPEGTSPHSSRPEDSSADNVSFQLSVPTGSPPNRTVPIEPSVNTQISAGPTPAITSTHHRTNEVFICNTSE